jgi:hypothetical protein
VQAAMEDGGEWSESADTSEKNNKSALKRFIVSYEQLPEPWNSASQSYSNEFKRNEALAKLLVIYKDIKPDAKVVDVRKKLYKTLRSNCRRELNRIKASKRSGSGTEEAYKPSSWVFHALKLLYIECPTTLMEDEESQVRKTVIYYFYC